MKKEKGFLEKIFGIFEISTKRTTPTRKKKIKNKFYLFRVERYKSCSNALGEYSILKKAKNAAQHMAKRSNLPIYIIKGRSRKEAESNVCGYSEDLDHPDEYIALNKAIRYTVCYYEGKQHKQYKRHRHHKH